MTQNNIPPTPKVLGHMKSNNNQQNTDQAKQTKQQNQQEKTKALDVAIEELTPEKKMTKAEIIDDIVKNLNLYKNEKGDYFVDVTLHNQPAFVRIDSELFELYVDNEMFNRSKQFLGKNLISKAKSRAQFYAKGYNRRIEAYQRFKGSLHKVYIDLCDQAGSVIEIDRTGWREVNQQNISDIRFIRDDSMLPLSKPDKDGNAFKILDFVNLNHREAQILFMVCLCSMPITDIHRPIIIFKGPEGSGKTFASRFFRGILDNVSDFANNIEKKEKDFALVYNQNAIPLFDNVSGLNKKESDMFCKAVTGGTLSNRKLFTDGNLYKTNYEGPSLITCINMPSKEPDFLDRCIFLEFNRIFESARKNESELNQAFEKDKASIFGGILNTLSKAMALYPNIDKNNIHRLAGFSSFGLAIAQVLGYSETEYCVAIKNNIQKYKTNILLRQNPVAEALIGLYKDKGPFTGSTTNLYTALGQYNPNNPEQRWPNNAIGLGKLLKNQKVISMLTDHGISIESKLSNKGTIVILKDINATRKAMDTGGKDEEEETETQETEIITFPFEIDEETKKRRELLARCHNCEYADKMQEYIEIEEEDEMNYCEIKRQPFSKLHDDERINCTDYESREDASKRSTAELEASFKSGGIVF